MNYPSIVVEKELDDTQEIVIRKDKLVHIEGERMSPGPYVALSMSNHEELDHYAIYLDSDYDWILGRTKQGTIVCVPQQK